jgi:hypothetical protein
VGLLLGELCLFAIQKLRDMGVFCSIWHGEGGWEGRVRGIFVDGFQKKQWIFFAHRYQEMFANQPRKDLTSFLDSCDPKNSTYTTT